MQKWKEDVASLSSFPNMDIILYEEDYDSNGEMALKIDENVCFHRLYIEVDVDKLEHIPQSFPTKQLYGKYYVLIDNN